MCSICGLPRVLICACRGTKKNKGNMPGQQKKSLHKKHSTKKNVLPEQLETEQTTPKRFQIDPLGRFFLFSLSLAWILLGCILDFRLDCTLDQNGEEDKYALEVSVQ